MLETKVEVMAKVELDDESGELCLTATAGFSFGYASCNASSVGLREGSLSWWVSDCSRSESLVVQDKAYWSPMSVKRRIDNKPTARYRRDIASDSIPDHLRVSTVSCIHDMHSSHYRGLLYARGTYLRGVHMRLIRQSCPVLLTPESLSSVHNFIKFLAMHAYIVCIRLDALIG